MSDQELLAETNRLLREFMEADQKQKQAAEASLQALKEAQQEQIAARESRMRSELWGRGLPDELTAGDSAEWERRSNDVRAQTEARIKDVQEAQERYRQDVLSELRTQSELLRKIAEILGS